MNKEAFLAELAKRLYGLSQSDLEERLAYFSEVIDEKVANGMTEETAVASIGSVDDVASRIMSEIPLSKLVKDRVQTEKRWTAGKIVLLLLLFPIWFPLAVTLFAVLFAFITVIWAVILALYAADLVLLLTAVVLIPGSVVLLFMAGPGGILTGIGTALILAALSILLFLFCSLLVRGTVKLMQLILTGIKFIFVGKKKDPVTVEGRWSY